MGAFTDPRPTNVSFDFAIYFSYPGYIQNDHIYISSAINIYCSIGCAILLCMLDLLICLMAFQIIGHIKTLILDFETMKRPKVVNTNWITEADNMIGIKMFSKEENDAVHIQLIEMVEHHKLIIRYRKRHKCKYQTFYIKHKPSCFRFVNRVSNFFGPMVAISYISHLIILCILLVECTSKVSFD